MSDIIISNIGPNVNSQFNELRVASKFPVVELTSVYGLSDLRDVVTTAGGGTVTNDGTEYLISTGVGGTDTAILESALRGRYQPGYAGEAGVGVRLPVNPTGTQVARWGLFDSENGAFFGTTSSTIFAAIRRGGVDTVIPQASWNVDPLDGSGPSGATLSLSEGNIYQIVFTWYGYGVVEFRVVIPNPLTLAQEVVTVHRYVPSGQTSFIDPNLPLRGEVDNAGTASSLTLFMGGRQYTIIGKFNPVFRITSEVRSVSGVGATLRPVISFRRKAEFPAGSGRPNSVNVLLQGVNIVSSLDIAFQVLVGGTVDGTFVNFPTATTNIPDDETSLLVNNNSTTFTGGEVVYQGVSSGGSSISRVTAQAELLDFQLPDDEIVTLAVANLEGGTATVNATFLVLESW
ncbi:MULTISPECIES: hypothetical protein [Bacillaceae]|uniref:hypothetical protein n=1 Tax=Bacillaceae TaxID=186817 RepID=UPI00101CA791|nr:MULTISPECIES: hypothetical protein [Bacillus]MDT0160737.1 hypothetical protein [Bacillus sp. AG4(2022)]MDW2878193.1 hypothetical protein [Bacillus infantis]RYI26604.1 hypothetical protein EVU96_19745 [Bacillus infantis]